MGTPREPLLRLQKRGSRLCIIRPHVGLKIEKKKCPDRGEGVLLACGETLWETLGEHIGEPLGGIPRGTLGETLREPLGEHLREPLGEPLWETLGKPYGKL